MISHIHSINSKDTVRSPHRYSLTITLHSKKVPDKKIANFYKKKFKVMQFEIVIMKTRINLPNTQEDNCSIQVRVPSFNTILNYK